MKYAVKTSLRHGNTIIEPGDIVELDEAEALSLLDINAVVIVAEATDEETEAKKPAGKKAAAPKAASKT